MSTPKKFVYRSAKTGRYVSAFYARSHPNTTYAVPYKKPVKPT